MKTTNLLRTLILLLLFNGFGEVSISQNIRNKNIGSVFITGITYDSKTLDILSNTNITLNNKAGYVTNENGRFSFYGSPGDSVEFSYIGYLTTKLVIPDTLKSSEYVVGIFMHEQTVKLAEIIILPRVMFSSMIVKPVATDQATMNLAQSHVDKAVVEGLTRSTKVYDAEMNAKKTMQHNQMQTEYKGMLVSPETTVGLSSQSFRINSIIFGSPITTPRRIAREVVTNRESELLIENFEALKREAFIQSIANPDSINKRNK